MAEKVIDKYDLMESIGLIFDELESARRELDATKRENQLLSQPKAESGGMSSIEVTLLKVGRRKAFQDSVRTYMTCVYASEDGRGVSVTPFDEFLDSFVANPPDYMSKNEFIEYFDDELRAEYARQRDAAVKELGDAE